MDKKPNKIHKDSKINNSTVQYIIKSYTTINTAHNSLAFLAASYLNLDRGGHTFSIVCSIIIAGYPTKFYANRVNRWLVIHNFSDPCSSIQAHGMTHKLHNQRKHGELQKMCLLIRLKVPGTECRPICDRICEKGVLYTHLIFHL